MATPAACAAPFAPAAVAAVPGREVAVPGQAAAIPAGAPGELAAVAESRRTAAGDSAAAGYPLGRAGSLAPAECPADPSSAAPTTARPAVAACHRTMLTAPAACPAGRANHRRPVVAASAARLVVGPRDSPAAAEPAAARAILPAAACRAVAAYRAARANHQRPALAAAADRAAVPRDWPAAVEAERAILRARLGAFRAACPVVGAGHPLAGTAAEARRVAAAFPAAPAGRAGQASLLAPAG